MNDMAVVESREFEVRIDSPRRGSWTRVASEDLSALRYAGVPLIPDDLLVRNRLLAALALSRALGDYVGRYRQDGVAILAYALAMFPGTDAALEMNPRFSTVVEEARKVLASVGDRALKAAAEQVSLPGDGQNG